MKQIPLGARGSFSLLVQPEHLANRFKDSMLPAVFATPVMIMVMENAALNAIKAYLEPGESAVGTEVNIRHLAATPAGRVVTGEAEVRQVFRVPRIGAIAGCYVLEGVIKRDSQIRVTRDGVVIYTSKLSSLKRFKDDASEVRAGFECGIVVANFNDVKEGDVLECFQVVKLSAAEAAAQGAVSARK